MLSNHALNEGIKECVNQWWWYSWRWTQAADCFKNILKFRFSLEFQSKQRFNEDWLKLTLNVSWMKERAWCKRSFFVSWNSVSLCVYLAPGKRVLEMLHPDPTPPIQQVRARKLNDASLCVLWDFPGAAPSCHRAEGLFINLGQRIALHLFLHLFETVFPLSLCQHHQYN